MNNRTFKEGFDSITRAYINNDLDPYSGCACFIGNLVGHSGWQFDGDSYYDRRDIYRMEANFLTIIRDKTVGEAAADFYIQQIPRSKVFKHPNYENALFDAMESTLEMLKQIHESKGQIVDTLYFRKRELTTI